MQNDFPVKCWVVFFHGFHPLFLETDLGNKIQRPTEKGLKWVNCGFVSRSRYSPIFSSTKNITISLLLYCPTFQASSHYLTWRSTQEENESKQEKLKKKEQGVEQPPRQMLDDSLIKTLLTEVQRHTLVGCSFRMKLHLSAHILAHILELSVYQPGTLFICTSHHLVLFLSQYRI